MNTVLLGFLGNRRHALETGVLLGVALFSGRWVVQLYASRIHRPTMLSRAFWCMSTSGSLLLLAQFIFGKNINSIGILSNLFPLPMVQNLGLES